ncbi:MAG TPA: hypothetical protein VKB80_34710 [Kofleriaceae bacterium]|nr:hypothetical protein [Kofleriaceae bacterium]
MTRRAWPRPLRWLWAENLALPIAAAVVGAAELLAVIAVYLAAFGPERRIPESIDNPLGHLVLWAAGLAGAALSCGGAYRLLRYGRAWLAALVVTAVCFPMMIVSLGSLYASLMLAAFL